MELVAGSGILEWGRSAAAALWESLRQLPEKAALDRVTALREAALTCSVGADGASCSGVSCGCSGCDKELAYFQEIDAAYKKVADALSRSLGPYGYHALLARAVAAEADTRFDWGPALRRVAAPGTERPRSWQERLRISVHEGICDDPAGIMDGRGVVRAGLPRAIM